MSTRSKVAQARAARPPQLPQVTQPKAGGPPWKSPQAFTDAVRAEAAARFVILDVPDAWKTVYVHAKGMFEPDEGARRLVRAASRARSALTAYMKIRKQEVPNELATDDHELRRECFDFVTDTLEGVRTHLGTASFEDCRDVPRTLLLLRMTAEYERISRTVVYSEFALISILAGIWEPNTLDISAGEAIEREANAIREARRLRERKEQRSERLLRHGFSGLLARRLRGLDD